MTPDRHENERDSEIARADRLQAELTQTITNRDQIATQLNEYVAENERLQAEVERLQLEKQEAEESEMRISKKLQLSHMNCACDYDHDGDLCMAHFPAKEALDKKLADQRAEIDRLQAEVNMSKEKAELMRASRDAWRNRFEVQDNALREVKAQLADIDAFLAGGMPVGTAEVPLIPRLKQLVEQRAEVDRLKAEVDQQRGGLAWMSECVIRECGGTPDPQGWIYKSFGMAEQYRSELMALTQQLAEQRAENEKWKTKALDLEWSIANALF